MNYDKYLSRKVKSFGPSGIRKYFDLLNDMEDGISLGVGEPDFITPEPIRNAAIESIKNCHTKYTSNAGLPELRKAIAEYQKRFIGVEYDPETEIVVTVGASEGIDLAMRTLLDDGDDILILEPSYVSYEPDVKLCGGIVNPIYLKADNKFRLAPEMIENAVTPKTKAILLAYPNNPTGAIMEREDLEKIAPVIIKHDLIVISDEIYSELTYGKKHVSIASLPGMRERTIVLNGFSKAFSMTGWRMGYFCAPKELAEQMYKIHQYLIMCASTQGQHAALFALRDAFANDFKYVREMRDEYDKRRVYMVRTFRDMGFDVFEPEGAFYVFPCVKSLGIGSEDFAYHLIMQKKVLVVPGEAFGEAGAGYLRCCYATDMERIKKAMTLIGEFVDDIRGGRLKI